MGNKKTFNSPHPGAVKSDVEEGKMSLKSFYWEEQTLIKITESDLAV